MALSPDTKDEVTTAQLMRVVFTRHPFESFAKVEELSLALLDAMKQWEEANPLDPRWP